MPTLLSPFDLSMLDRHFPAEASHGFRETMLACLPYARSLYTHVLHIQMQRAVPCLLCQGASLHAPPQASVPLPGPCVAPVGMSCVGARVKSHDMNLCSEICACTLAAVILVTNVVNVFAASGASHQVGCTWQCTLRSRGTNQTTGGGW